MGPIKVQSVDSEDINEVLNNFFSSVFTEKNITVEEFRERDRDGPPESWYHLKRGDEC